MKNIYKHIIFLPILFSMFSCEEVIEIDLNSSDPALVVEAFLYKDSLCHVHLTKTANYFTSDDPQPINDAIITLIADSLVEETLNYVGNGYYEGEIIRGSEDVLYKLMITWEGKEYSGSSRLYAPAEILSLEIVEYNPAPMAPVFKQLSCTFMDNPVHQNYYYIRYIQNDTVLYDPYIVLPDENFSTTDTIEFTNPMIFFDTGDHLEVQLFSIDESLFTYYTQLNNILSDNFMMSSTPYNPTSNIQGAMGYFATWSFVSDTITVKDY